MKTKFRNDNFIIVHFKGIDYNIDKRKLEAVFSLLENKNITIKSTEDVSELLVKYKLYDKDFLENINRI